MLTLAKGQTMLDAGPRAPPPPSAALDGGRSRSGHLFRFPLGPPGRFLIAPTSQSGFRSEKNWIGQDCPRELCSGSRSEVP
eukprot:4504593-Pyramimonas_sp.AAC.1